MILSSTIGCGAFLTAEQISLEPYVRNSPKPTVYVKFRNGFKTCLCSPCREITEQLADAAGFESYKVDAVEQEDGSWLIGFASNSILSNGYARMTAAEMRRALEQGGVL